jgi:putative ABC transport system substrate-binding protein
MRRREFSTLLGGAGVAWPGVARAQQAAVPVIGFLNGQSPEGYVEQLRAFRQGLKDTGYVEGENLTVEYRWANNDFDRLRPLADELVRRRVAVIATTGGPASVLAAKAATVTIPTVFAVAGDPVEQGLVASLARPGGNLTGVTFLVVQLSGKRLELLRGLTPAAARLAVLVNAAETASPEPRDVQTAARALGLQLMVYNADNIREIDSAFENMARDRPDALYVATTPLFVTRRIQLVHWATFLKLPAIYGLRSFPEAGGLMSYGSSIGDAFRQVGIYAGRILKGAKPAELPVVQASKFELVINFSAARMLGLTIPVSLLAIADEVIE